MPVETRSLETTCCKASDVTGNTEIPSSSIRNVYSLVPWVEPRYLTTRKRREEVCSLTRWSSTITQSETYSSEPWRVSVPSPRSPVMMAVTPFSFSQRNRRRSSARRMSGLGKPENSDSTVSSTTLDTVESLFSGLPNPLILRAELRRLFRWLKEKGVTAIITGERGDGTLTRQGSEEYVSDCVIVLDHRVSEQTSSRRLRVVKYRGSTHGTNEYTFLIDEDGISVLPVTSLALQHVVSSERVSTGITRLDAMLGGKGYYRGSSVLVSGTAGTGKSSFAALFADAACHRGERVLYFSFEESPSQIMRNMRSIGIELQPWVKKGLLEFHANRPSFAGLETHLAMKHKVIDLSLIH